MILIFIFLTIMISKEIRILKPMLNKSIHFSFLLSLFFKRLMGLEPTISCLASRRVNQLRYNRTRRAAVINEMLRSFPGFHSRLLELAILHWRAARGTRTPNPVITSDLRYQLRHDGKCGYVLGYHSASMPRRICNRSGARP